MPYYEQRKPTVGDRFRRLSVRTYMGAGALVGSVAGGAGTWVYGRSVAPQMDAERKLAEQVLSGEHAPDVTIGRQHVVGTPEQVADALMDHISDVGVGVVLAGAVMVGVGALVGAVAGESVGRAAHGLPGKFNTPGR